MKTGDYVTPTITYNHRAIQHAQAEKPAIDRFSPHPSNSGIKKVLAFLSA
jgi:hypothetical protein